MVLVGRIIRAVLVRPWLWPVAITTLVRLVPRSGWRRWPPAPDPDYLRFRMVTQYGDPGRVPEPDDVIAYLEWRRRWPSVAA